MSGVPNVNYIQFPDGSKQYFAGGGSTYWLPTTSGPTGIYYSSGNVGIGTSTPLYLLDVSGNSRFAQDSLINGLTIAPIRLYKNERNLIKIDIALVKGKKIWDKKNTIKERDIQRELNRNL
jgi:hypothetical protein